MHPVDYTEPMANSNANLLVKLPLVWMECTFFNIIQTVAWLTILSDQLTLVYGHSLSSTTMDPCMLVLQGWATDADHSLVSDCSRLQDA